MDMPRLSGSRLIQAVRKDRPELPIAAISGSSAPGREEEIRLLEVGFLLKPFSTQALLNAVAQLLEKEP
jgi:CheY-like chemotaxis protein